MFLGETILIDFSLGFSFEHKEAPHVALTNKPKSVIRPFSVLFYNCLQSFAFYKLSFDCF